MTNKKTKKQQLKQATLKVIKNPDRYDRFAHAYLVDKFAFAFLRK